ncbi:MAG: helix-turn-helix domain-containing protein [Candidatus Uhrbacteria bacterium]
MDKIISHLAEIVGLSDKEAEIYVALLALGEASIIEIAKKAEVKRTTVYNLLPNMVKNGFIQTALKKKRRVYFIEDVRDLQTNLQNKEKRLSKMLPELQAVHNILPFKPKITYYEGFEGLKTIFLDTIKSSQPGDEILEIIGTKDVYKFFTREFAEEYWELRRQNKISLKMLAPRGSESIDAHKNRVRDLRRVKFLEDSKNKFQSVMDIYGNKVAMLSYTENFMGVIIESKQISDMHRAAFGALWNALPEPKI